jgi:hypothetical protein
MPGNGEHSIGDILAPIITGLFGLAGVLLGDYLKKRGEGPPTRKSTEKRQAELELPQPDQRDSSPIQLPTPVVQPKPRTSRNAFQGDDFSKTSPGAIFATVVNFGTMCGGAFVANWLFDWGARVFNIVLQPPRGYLTCLLLAALVWGVVYVCLAFMFATNWVELLLAPLIGWFTLFESIDFGEFIRSVLSALPLNIVLALGAAYAGATFAAKSLHAQYDGVFYLVFGVVTALELGACIANN